VLVLLLRFELQPAATGCADDQPAQGIFNESQSIVLLG
jgi:hypothetical protein